MRLRDRVGITERRQRQITRVMEVFLLGLLFVGLERRDVGIVLTCAVALGVAKLPAVLERDYEIELDAGLTLWITTAVFLHAVGVGGIPGTDQIPYRTIPGYDHVTHALSASVIAAVGYTTVRALDGHSERIYLPPRFTFVFVLLFVLAFGVFWEIVEFGTDALSASLGVDVTGATQHGLEDTMIDLVFDAVGGVIVGAWGHAHLNEVVGVLQRRLDGRGAD